MKYIIIGCGISGATIGRILAENDLQVEIWDRRNHIAGNMYDYKDDHGILVHQYGPHIFHTNSETVWEFIQRFEKWKEFKLVCGASWDGKYTPTAFNFKTIDTFYEPDKAEVLKKKLLEAYGGRGYATVVEVLENRDPDIRGYAEYLFKNDYAPYTAKQWGISAGEIDPIVLKRVPLRFSYDESYFTDRYEAMPVNGYTKMFENMLNHSNIVLKLETDALSHVQINNGYISVDGKTDDVVIYTGALDELFNYIYGELPYRSLRFEWKYEETDSYQPAPVVAYPQAPGYTRITEYKKLPVQNVKGTTYAIEYPIKYEIELKSEPYYPVLTEESKDKYEKYVDYSRQIKNLFCCGRLANFKYFNMDEAITNAMEVANQIIKNNKI